MDSHNNENRLERIDRYLLDQMSDEERKNFEEEIENDPSLAKEVENARTFLVGMENLDSDQLRKELRDTNQVIDQIRQTTDLNFDQPADTPDNSRTYKIKPLLAKAAGIAAILLLLFLPAYFLIFQSPDANVLFNKYYKTPPNLITVETRSGSDKASRLSKIMAPYESRNYQEALKQANEYLKTHPGNSSMLFYRGVMHLELGHHQKAINDLQAAKSQNKNYQDKASWYLALVQLAANNEQKARAHLKELQKGPPSRYREKATELLRDLE